MNATVSGAALSLALLLSASPVRPVAAGQGDRSPAVFAQAPGSPAGAGAVVDLGRADPANATACPPGTDENVCAVLRQPLPSSVPRRGPVLNQRDIPYGLSNQESLRGMSLGK